jgi:hypothetical protein
MLSLRRCRELLGPKYTFSDGDLMVLRDQLYAIALIALEAFASQGEQEPEPVSAKDEAGG